MPRLYQYHFELPVRRSPAIPVGKRFRPEPGTGKPGVRKKPVKRNPSGPLTSPSSPGRLTPPTHPHPSAPGRLTSPTHPHPSTPTLRLLQLSDLHMWPASTQLVRFLHQLAQQVKDGTLEVDLVLLTGDNFAANSGFTRLKTALEPLCELLPGLYVFGSNDYYSGSFKLPTHYFLNTTPKLRNVPDLPTEEFSAWLASFGWKNANNANGTLSVANLQLAYSGVNDPHIGHDLPTEYPADWQSADLRLGLTHAPYARVLNQFCAARADLVVAGHTHGGQICLPKRRALTNNSDIDLSFSGGLHQWTLGTQTRMAPRKSKGKVYALPNLEQISYHLFRSETDHQRPMWLHVSRGLGTSRYTPVRLLCPPEASVLNISVPQTNWRSFKGKSK